MRRIDLGREGGREGKMKNESEKEGNNISNWMCHNALCFVFEVRGELGGNNAGGGASHDSGTISMLVHLSKDLLFQRQVLWSALLHGMRDLTTP